ncbi:unnamed protein product, partial [Phaeothamnion confervicola]
SFILFAEDGKTISLKAFVITLFNYCTKMQSSLTRLMFDMYDETVKGSIDLRAMGAMLADVYGDKWHDNEKAEAIYSTFAAQSPMDIAAFEEFAGGLPNLLSAAFAVQHAMQERSLGLRGWQKVANRTRDVQAKREQTIRMLLGQAQAMGDPMSVEEAQSAVLELRRQHAREGWFFGTKFVRLQAMSPMEPPAPENDHGGKELPNTPPPAATAGMVAGAARAAAVAARRGSTRRSRKSNDSTSIDRGRAASGAEKAALDRLVRARATTQGSRSSTGGAPNDIGGGGGGGDGGSDDADGGGGSKRRSTKVLAIEAGALEAES